MRPGRLLLIAFFGSFFPIPTAAQQTQTPTSPPLQRDPQAMAVLAQMAAATGWRASSVPADVVATGTVTRFQGDAEQTVPFTVKQRGASQQRLQFQEPDGLVTTVVNGLAASVLPAQGRPRRLPAQSALSMESRFFPFFSDILKLLDADVSVVDLGSGTIEGVPCHGVQIARHPAGKDSLSHIRELASPLKVWISQSTFLPVQIEYVRLAVDNQHVVMHFSRAFSDYRVVNGIAVAFQQVERFEGQLMYRFQLTNVQLNAGLTDVDFDTDKL
jgi:hypothetical protein